MKEPLVLTMNAKLIDSEGNEAWDIVNTYKNMKYEDVVLVQNSVMNALARLGMDKGNVDPTQGDKPPKPAKP